MPKVVAGVGGRGGGLEPGDVIVAIDGKRGPHHGGRRPGRAAKQAGRHGRGHLRARAARSSTGTADARPPAADPSRAPARAPTGGARRGQSRRRGSPCPTRPPPIPTLRPSRPGPMPRSCTSARSPPTGTSAPTSATSRSSTTSATRVNARLMLLPPHDPQFKRNRERVNRDAERENIILAGTRPGPTTTTTPTADRRRAARTPIPPPSAPSSALGSAAAMSVDADRRPAPVPEPGAVLARLQRRGSSPWPRTPDAAARAGQVPGHLQPEPGRVLPGPRRRPEGPGRAPGSGAARRRPHRRRSSSSVIRERVARAVGPGRRGVPRARSAPALAEVGIRFSSWNQLDEDDREWLIGGVRAPDLPGAHPAGGRPRPPVPLHLQPVAEPGGDRPATRPTASAASPG